MSIRHASGFLPMTGRIAGALLLLLLLLLFLPALRPLLVQILFGTLLAALALPLARRLEKHMSPSPAALLSVGALLVTGLGFLALLAPHIIAQISLALTMAPQFLARLQEWWEALSGQEWVSALGIDPAAPREWLGALTDFFRDNLPRVLSALGSAADGISKAFLSPLLAFYFIRDRAYFSYRLCLWIPGRWRKRALAALQEMRKEAVGYLRGQMLVACAVGALTAIGLLLAGIPAWLALGLMMGMCEWIPYVGPLIGAVPVVLFSLPMGLPSLLWALGITAAVQQIESWFLSPRLMAGATGLHPVYVVALLSAGGLLGGLMGMVAVLPLFVCFRGAARVFCETKENENVKFTAPKGKIQ